MILHRHKVTESSSRVNIDWLHLHIMFLSHAIPLWMQRALIKKQFERALLGL